MTIASLVQILLTAGIGLLVSIFLYRIKIRDARHDEERKRRIKIDVAERELMLSMAGAIEVMERKIAGEQINGELEKSVKDLTEKKRTLQKETRVIFYEEIEE